ncbi:MAG TPA: ComEA family DNA-binding protein [bacterium]|nr:ComEA family DNA-binding protein [bacterium]
MPDRDSDHHAGPYGFSRREIVALLALALVGCALVAIDHWAESRRPQAPVWALEDVFLEPRAEPDSARHAGDSAAARPRRDYAQEIDINTADVRALARLPGIGPELARRIVAERDANGAFVNLIDLQRVRGIGPRKAAMLSGWVRFSQPAADTAGKGGQP